MGWIVWMGWKIWMELELDMLEYWVRAGVILAGLFGLNFCGKGWNIWLEVESNGLRYFD
jgi:hypothetical protein